MNNLVAIFVSALVTSSSASLIQPLDLAAEAKEQLNQLKSIIHGDIMVAHDDIDFLLNEFRIYTTGDSRVANLSIEQQQQSVQNQINTMLSLADSAGKDVSLCTKLRNESIDSLPERFIGEIRNCLDEGDTGTVRVTGHAKYVVDIIANAVIKLEAQLGLCGVDFLCLSSLVTQIQLDKIKLPQEIRTEVQSTETLLTNMRLAFKSCADSNVASYTTVLYTMFTEIKECVDEILG